MSTVQLAVLSVAAAAGAIDLRQRRIPNWLTLGAALAGLAYHVASTGVSGVLVATLGWVVGIAMMFLPFALGGLGAGDVKLLGALGAWLGPGDAVWLALFTGIAGGVLAVTVSLARGYFGQAMHNVRTLLIHWQISGLRPMPEMTIHYGKGPKLAYGLAIFAGAMVTIWTR